MVEELFEGLSEINDVTLLTGADAPSPRGSGKILRAPFAGILGFLAWLVLALPRELRRGGYDVAISVNALIASTARFCRPFAGTPHAALVFGSDLSYANWLYRNFLRLTLPSMDRVVAISRHVAGLAMEYGVSKSNIVVLPPGINPEYARLASRSDLPVPSAPVLLFVGRVIPRKGLGVFLDQCLPLILDQEEVELWVVGDEAKDSLRHSAGEYSRVRRSLATKPYREKVRFLGKVSDEVLRAAYQKSRILILPAVPAPHDVEGFGIVFLEAALFGVPAVSTAIGGIPEAVVDGETGLLVRPGDWVDFAAQVVRLIRDDELHATLGKQARRRAAADFSWQRLASFCTEQLSKIPSR